MENNNENEIVQEEPMNVNEENKDNISDSSMNLNNENTSVDSEENNVIQEEPLNVTEENKDNISDASMKLNNENTSIDTEEKNMNSISESGEDKEPKKNKNKGLIIVIIILVIALLCGAGYFCYDKFLAKEEKNKTNESKKETINQETTKEDIEGSEKELDLTKSLNTTDITYSNPVLLTNKDDNIGLSIDISSDKKSATLNIDWSKFGPISKATLYADVEENYDIKGFNRNISSGYIGNIGQDSMGLRLFFIMEDQTVEYLNMFELKTDSQGNQYYEVAYSFEKDSEGKIISTYFKSKGKISGVNGITKLYGANAGGQGTGGYYTTLAKKKDGSFYNLSDAIK